MRVVKIGGRVQADLALAPALARLWHAHPGSLCVVHGGGDELSALQRRLGVEPAFSGGRRLSTDADVELARMALSGVSNKQLVARLVAAGAPAVGISGEDSALLSAEALDAGRLGRVGAPSRVREDLLRVLLGAGYLPVVSPVSADANEPGRALNVNADDAASAIAASLRADELLLVADVPGVRAEGAVLGAILLEEALALVARGTAEGGMAAKLEAAVAALHRGVARVRIGDLHALEDPARGTTLTLPRSAAA